MLVANPDCTMPPMDAGIDVLNAYRGVENVGVDMRELGRTVWIVVCGVKEVEDCDWTGELVFTDAARFLRGYKPIFGGSLVLMP